MRTPSPGRTPPPQLGGGRASPEAGRGGPGVPPGSPQPLQVWDSLHRHSNYYELLGVHPDASTEEVKRAFFTKSKELHPDRDPGNPALHSRFVELSEAYRVLSREQSRRSYDRQLRSARPPGSPGTTAHPKSAGQTHSSWTPPNEEYWAQFHGTRPRGPESRQQQHRPNQRVLGYCLLLMLAGMGLHYVAFRKLEQMHRRFMDEKDRIITAIYNDTRARARSVPRKLILPLSQRRTLRRWASRVLVVSWLDVYARAACQPREVVVPLAVELVGTVAKQLVPSCVTVRRCGGCCPDDGLECVPTGQHQVRMQILMIRYPSSQLGEVSLEEHSQCECRPKKRESAVKPDSPRALCPRCTQRRQRPDPRTCRCRRRSFLRCQGRGLELNPDTCRCRKLRR
ncbi:vascular endothelial growth factor B [Carlito syrichta]|uniref:DnaJ homolog subfamily C member 4 n=1 Tax=Carlito syrichta TaxID=1868482 RepID=A0A3Q0DP64_CARSF|nr:vascular endothelial growth factor B [Carlito syrichta]